MAESLSFRAQAIDDGVLAFLQGVDTAIARVQAEFQKLSTGSSSAAKGFDQVASSGGGAEKHVTAAATATGVLGQAFTKTGQSAQATTQHFDGMGTSLRGVIQQGFGISAGMLGFQSVATAVSAAVGSMVNFEAKMNNVNTLVQGNVPLQQQLRAELLQLPPVLGSSTELAEGLYAALSAGIEPGKAVAFVGEAAKTAKAGLTDMETSVNSLASVMQAYGIESQNVTQVSDIMFQTVNVGKGKFDEFAHAFATVSPLAKTLGISLKETAATLGTLSFAFPTAAEGAVGYRSVLSNLIQNMDKFRALGIDVQKVIGEEGFTGLMKRMQLATRGNVEQLRELIPDVQGLSAALALSGPQAELQTKNLEAMNQATGKGAEAFREMSKGTKAAWDELLASLDRLGNKVAPPLLGALTSITHGLTELVGEASAFQQLRFSLVLEDVGTAALFAANRLGEAKIEAGGLTFTFGNLVGAFFDGAKGMLGLETALGATLRKQIEANAVWNDFGDTLGATSTTVTTKVVPALQDIPKVFAASDITAKNFFNTLTQGFEGIRGPMDDFRTQWEQVGITAPKVLKEAVTQALEGLKLIASSSESSAVTVQRSWEGTRQKIVAAYGFLPKEFQAIDEAIKTGNIALARTLIENMTVTTAGITETYNTVPPTMQRANDAMVVGAQGAARGIGAAFGELEVDVNGRLVPKLQAGMMDMYGVLTQAGRTYVEGWRAQMEAGATAVLAAASRAAAQAALAAEASMERMRSFVTVQLGAALDVATIKFGTTMAELERQYLETLQSFNGLAQRASVLGGDFLRDQQRILLDTMAEIQRRRNELQTVPVRAGTNTGSGGTPGGPIDYGYGLPGMASGGLVPGYGAPDSLVTRVSPGEFLIPPKEVAQLMAMLREALPNRQGSRGTTAMRTTTPPIINVSIAYTGVQNARQMVRDLRDAITEEMRRGGFTLAVR